MAAHAISTGLGILVRNSRTSVATPTTTVSSSPIAKRLADRDRFAHLGLTVAAALVDKFAVPWIINCNRPA